MIKLFRNIKQKIKSSDFIRGNPESVNILIFLFVLSYFTIGFDLSKEMAKGKNEIGFFAAVLGDTYNNVNLDFQNSLIVDPPVIGEVPPVKYTFPNNDVTTLPHDRAPPLV